MPKRYRIEMSLFDDASNTQLDTDSDSETYQDDEEAQAKFTDKKEAAHDAGKGRPA